MLIALITRYTSGALQTLLDNNSAHLAILRKQVSGYELDRY